ncbi:MAG: Rv3235 family protein [Propionibacteriaceae bacterium]|nr:Rv3235 family protein [Propionibacteriaceae bacterium]
MTPHHATRSHTIVAAALIDEPLPCAPAPDLRPEPVRWHRQTDAPLSTWMAPLPLSDAAAIPTFADQLRSDLRAETDGLHAHARSLVSALVDVIQRRRPATQLVRWVSDTVLADLAFLARATQRSPRRLVVRSVRLQVVTPDVAEVSARVQSDHRHQALALRLERQEERWFCPLVDFGPGPRVPGGPMVSGKGQRRL